jgi:hypothetical protein
MNKMHKSIQGRSPLWRSIQPRWIQGRSIQFRTVLLPASLSAFLWTGVWIAVSSTNLPAQQGGTPQSPGSPASVQVPTTSSPDTPQSASSVDLKPVRTELQGKLDSKSAKSGDPVVVKTTESVKATDGTEIPKGSRLLGHVIQVRPHSEASPNSAVAVNFDQVQMKNGQTLPIHSVIQSVDPPAGSQSGASDTMAAERTGPAAGGGASAGGSRASTGSTAPTPSAPMPSTAGGSSSTPVSAGTSTAGRVVAGSGPNAIRTTDIPNIYLASDAAGPVSGTLYSAKTDVHLDGGTALVLAIAPGPAGSH